MNLVEEIFLSYRTCQYETPYGFRPGGKEWCCAGLQSRARCTNIINYQYSTPKQDAGCICRCAEKGTRDILVAFVNRQADLRRCCALPYDHSVMKGYLYLHCTYLCQQMCVVIAALLLPFSVQWHRYDRVGLHSVMPVRFRQQSSQWLGKTCIPVIFQGMDAGAKWPLIATDCT
jgi:hypothetical protein